MKTKQRRILAFFLSLVMVLGMLPTVVLAEESDRLDDFPAAQAPSAIELRDITCTEGEPVTLDGATESDDGGEITYQWYQSGDREIDAEDAGEEEKNDVLLEGETSAILALEDLAEGVYYYFVIATNTVVDGEIIYTADTASNVAAVTVSPAESGETNELAAENEPGAEDEMELPVDETDNSEETNEPGIQVASGAETFNGLSYAKQLTLTASGTGGLTVNDSGFQWQHSASENGAWEPIDGGNASRLTLRVALGETPINGYYRCVYTHHVEDQEDQVYTSEPVWIHLENPVLGVYINPKAEDEEDADGETIKHKGSDQNEGYSPIAPVRSLNRALDQYNALIADQSLQKAEDLRIFVLNPIQVSGDTGGTDNYWPAGVTLQRYQNNGYMFQVVGGTLTLNGITLDAAVRESASGSLEPLFNLSGGRLHAVNTEIPSVAVTTPENYVGTADPAITVSGQPDMPISVLIAGETEGQRISLLGNAGNDSISDAGEYVHIVSNNWKADVADGVVTAVYDSGVVAGSAVYLDGANGSDNNDGSAPGDAVKTFAKALDLVTADGVIYICGTVTLRNGDSIDGSSKPGVTIRRNSGFTNDLFIVAEGTSSSTTTATINGITVDGNGSGTNIVASSWVNLTVKNSILRNGARGIYYSNSGSSSTITIENVTITGNTSDGIYLYHSNGNIQNRNLTVSVKNSIISGNGGKGINGVSAGYKAVTISDTEISGNNSDGIYLQGGRLWLIGTTSVINNKGDGVEIDRYWNAWGTNQRGLSVADNVVISGNTGNALKFTNSRGSENGNHISHLTLTGGRIEGKIEVSYGSGSAAVNRVNWDSTQVEGTLSLTDGIPILFSKAPSAIGNQAYKLTLDKYYIAGTVVAQRSDGTDLTEADFQLFSATFPTGSDNLRIGLEKGKIVVIDTDYIYVDPVDGSDGNDGSSPGQGTQTMEKAIEIVKANAATRTTPQKIAVMSAVPVSTTTSWDGQVGTQKITVTPYGTIDGPFLNVQTGGDLSITNMTFDCLKNQKYGFTVSGGSLTMGSNTALNNTMDTALTISDGGSFAMTGNAQLKTGYKAVQLGGGSFTMAGSSSISGFTIDRGLINMGYNSGPSATFTMKDDAVISGNTATAAGQYLITVNNSGKLIMVDNAAIKNNSAGKGAIFIAGSATMEMRGGSVANNTATRTDILSCCGGIWVEGTLKVIDGTINGNTHNISTELYNTLHKDVYLNSNGKLQLGGCAVIGSPIYLTTSTPISVVEPMTESASVTLYPVETLVGKTVVAMTNSVSAEDSLEHFSIDKSLTEKGIYVLDVNSDNTAIILKNPNSDIYLSSSGSDSNDGRSTATPVATFAKAKALVGDGCQIIICGQVNVANTQEWNLSEKPDVTVRRAVNYTGVLVNVTSSGNLTLKNITIDGDKNSNLNGCSAMLKLNGGTATLGENAILQNNKGGGIDMSGGTLNLLDGSTIQGGTSWAVHAGSGTVNMSGGTISGNTVDNPSSGRSGVVYLENSSTTMTITGGSITNNTLTGYNHSGYAAAVTVYNGAQLFIRNGLLDGVSAKDKRQSTVYAEGGTVTMTGGTISGKQPVLVGSGGRFNMSGGTITETSAPTGWAATVTVLSGGRFAMTDGTVNAGYGTSGGLSGVKVDSGGTLTMTGGTIQPASGATSTYCGVSNAGTANISGGVITGMTDSGIVNTAGTLNISGTAQITGNKAASGGGVRGTGGNITISGGTIAGNTATSSGGGVYANGANLTISGGTIGGAEENQGNTAASYGGGVYFTHSARTLTMTGGEITGNTTPNNGGGLYLLDNYRADLTGGSISGNSAKYGGGIFSAGTLTAQGVAITNNTADTNGGGLCVYSGTTYLNAGTTISSNKAAANGGGLQVERESTTVTLSGAAITGNEANGSGGGFFIKENAVVETVSGTVSGNTAASNPASTGFYVTDGSLQLRGGGAEISDTIYLANKNYPITLTYGMSGGNVYTVAVNTDTSTSGFAIGDTVVQPSRVNVMDAGQYLSSFTLLAESNMTLIASDSNLILSRCYFVGGTGASDTNDGTSPAKSFATIERALKELAAKGDRAGTIYLCGNVELTGTLTLGAGITLRPYTGFNVGGTETGVDAYAGTLITVGNGGALNLAGASILGSASSSAPLFKVENGGAVTMTGGEIRGHGNLAVDIESGGALTLSGGSITGCANGDGTAIQVGGTLKLSGNPTLTGGQIYLEAGKVITITGELNLPRMITVDMAGAVTGSAIATTTSEAIAASAKNQFHLATGLSGLYRVSVSGTDLILAAKSKVYLDPVTGNDDHNGSSPANAVRTLKQAYERVKDTGGAIYIMNTVNITGNVTLTSTGYSDGSNSVTASDTVDFIRYVKPSAVVTNYSDYDSCSDALFSVAAGGTLTLNGVNIDGHHASVTSGQPEDITAAFTASAPLITATGTLKLDSVTLSNNRSSGTTGGAVSITGTGSLEMTGANTSSGALDSGGTAIFHSGGGFTLTGSPVLEGTVSLAADKYISATTDLQVADPISVFLERAESGVTVVSYSEPYENSAFELVKFTVANASSLYLTGNAIGNALVLSNVTNIYVDGQNGSDRNTGYTPKSALKTLPAAVTAAKAIEGAQVVVVGQVDVGRSVAIDGVTVIRYVKPESSSVEGFNVPSYEGVLVNVMSGADLTLNSGASIGSRDSQAAAIKASGSLTLNSGAVIGDVVLASGGTLKISGNPTVGVITLEEGAYVTEGANLTASIILKPAKTDVGTLLVKNSSESTMSYYSMDSSITLGNGKALHLFSTELYIAAQTGLTLTMPADLVEDGKAKEAMAALTRLDTNASVTDAAITLTYYTDESCTTQTTQENSGVSQNGGAPTKAGTYYVKAVYAGDKASSLMPTETQPAMFTIKQGVAVAETPQTFTYDGQAHSFEVKPQSENMVGFDAVQYLAGGTWTTEAPINAGHYDVKITRPADDTYAALDVTITGGLVIEKATVTVDFINSIDTTPKADGAPIVPGEDFTAATVSGGTLTETDVNKILYAYTTDDSRPTVPTMTSLPTEAGDYFLWAYYPGDDNHEAAWSDSVSLTINVAGYTVSGTFIYNGADAFETTVKLYAGDAVDTTDKVDDTETQPLYAFEVVAENMSDGQGSFAIPEVADGAYTLVISKKNHTDAFVFNLKVDGEGVEIAAQPVLYAGDLVSSNRIDMQDYTRLMGSYNQSSATYDLDGNGQVNMQDYTLLMGHYNDGAFSITLK